MPWRHESDLLRCILNANLIVVMVSFGVRGKVRVGEVLVLLLVIELLAT